MNIIVVGCGKVGQAIVQQLSDEGNDITVIDIDEKKINEASRKYDVMGVIGNGATHSVQLEAGIEHTDLMIAVTASDELNLLCCLVAKKAGKCQTIARVRNPEYSKDAPYLQEELRLAMVINPEFAAASEIARVIRFPSAVKIDTFAKGKLELLKFRLPNNCILTDYSVKEISSKLKCDVLVCMIERKDEAIIPGGDMTFKQGDMISIVATPQNANKFFKKINYHSNQIKNLMIAGGGNIAYYLSKMLLKTGISVKIIDRNKQRCEELCVKLPKATIIHGDASENETLLEEGIDNMGAFVALTNLDEENILLSLFAHSRMNGKIVTKVNRIEYDEIIQKLDLDSIVNPKHITAENIVQFVRAMKNSMGSNVETLYSLIKGKVEAAEFVIRERSSILDTQLQSLKFKPNVLIACIVRNNDMIIPRGQDTIKLGDSVVVVSRHLGLHDICDILE
ncbi:MAG: Trk system potassium transporter TrkA [Ruminococcus sp.]|nr:Trk system potassium transporter TrkA [Ruminococcus sp.]